MIGWFNRSLHHLFEQYTAIAGRTGAWFEDGSGYVPPARMGDDSPAAVFDVFGWSFEDIPVLHAHSGVTHQWELVCMERGEVSIIAGNRDIRLRPDELILIPPRTGWKARRARGYPSTGIQIIAGMHFPELHALALRPIPLNAHLRNLLQRITPPLLVAPKAPGGSGIRLNLLHFLFSLLETAQIPGTRMPSGSSLENALIKEAKRLMEEAGSRQLSLPELASRCRTDPFTLARIFKRHTGVPPFRYHTRLRMEIAKKMLRDDRQTVSQVAEQLGYSDPAPFSRIFKRIIGVPPAAYARRFRPAREGKKLK